MKNKLNLLIRSSRRLIKSVAPAVPLVLIALGGQKALASDILWTGGTSGSSTVWTNVANWTGGVAPAGGDNAVFNSAFTGNPLTINRNPLNSLTVGSITYGPASTIPLVIKAQSSAVNPTTLFLNGAGGILLSNTSTTFSVNIVGTNTVNANQFYLGLAASGSVYANATTTPPGTPGSINILSSITESGGSQGFTLTGPGIVFLRNTNSYTGSTVVSNGTLEVDDVGTIGSGAGTLYLSGGNLLCGADRAGTTTTATQLTNPIVVTADTFVYNKAGNANSSRRLPLAGPITSTGGTFKIANPTTASSGQNFIVRLFGAYTFAVPISVGEVNDPIYQDNTQDFSYLELCNSNGVQTFAYPISGRGGVFRSNPLNLSAAGGASILTANNSYTGGTTISSGTLFANNTTGSALGSGSVLVTNGTLAGNGFVVAPTTVSANGIISPGATTNGIANLSVSDLTFGPAAKYVWQIASVTGTAGTSWDLITCSSDWSDAASGGQVVIKIDSLGVVPTGWNSGTAYDWVIIESGTANSFDSSHFAVDLSSFSGTVNGGFNTYVSGGELHLTYTPGSDFVINVPSGSQSQTAGYGTITGGTNVIKVGNGETVFDNAANTYSGLTKVLAGTLSLTVNALNGSGALGANSSPTLLGNTTGNSNATLNVSVDGVTDAHGITVQAGSTGTKTIGTTLTSGTATYSGGVTLQDSVTLNAATGGADLFAGNFSGSGGITFAGGGTYTMSGVGSYAGPTTLTGGSLNLNAKSLGTNTFTISSPSTLDNTSAGSVTLNSSPQNWNADFAFTGTSSLNLGAGAVTINTNRTLTVNNNTLTVGGPIAGNGGLTKAGTGTLAFTAATNSTYTGGTTNLAGVLAINATSTFGNGNGPLVLAGGNLLSTGTRSGLPIANPVIMSANTRMYGNSTDTTANNRYLPFTGAFTVTGGSTLYIDNLGSATTIFDVILQGTNYTAINWPVVIGDATFDTAGALAALNLFNPNTGPVQTVSGLISGPGSVVRSYPSVNSGGTTIFTAQNTFSGGVQFNSGVIGFGASSTVSGGTIVSGPIGTGQLTFGSSNSETNLTVFAVSGSTEIDNKILFNGDTNITFAGANNMLFTAGINSGNSAKTLVVTNGLTVTFSGAVTNTGSSGGAPLTKIGGGTLVMSGVSTYAGSTTVSGGTLLLSGALGTNVVTVNAGGTLAGSGNIGGSLAFSSGGQAYLYKSAGSPDSPLTVAGNLTLNGNSVVVDLGGTTTLGVGTYTLLSYGGTLSGAFNATPSIVNGSLASGKAATIDLSTPNAVNLVVATASTTPPGFAGGSVGVLPTGNISLVATGAVGSTYHLWASTNIALKPVTTTWTLLNSGTVTASPFTNFDLTATNYPQRFYLFTAP